MSQVTNGLTSIPDTVQPFSAPAYRPGTSPILSQSYGGVSTLMEQGYMRPTPAPSFAPSAPPSTANLPTSLTALPVQNPTGQGAGTNTIPNTGAPQSQALIIAQPQSIARGTPLIVSWSSVGMSADSPCQVAEGSIVIGKGNSSSITVATNALPVGAVTFKLSCLTRSGNVFQQSVSVTIR